MRHLKSEYLSFSVRDASQKKSVTKVLCSQIAADPHDSLRFCKKVSESAVCLKSLGLARRMREDELM